MSRRKPVENARWKPKQTQCNNRTVQKQAKTIEKTIQKTVKQQRNQETESKLQDWMTDNLEQQKCEFESIMDIYSNEITVLKKPTSYQFKLTNEKNKSQYITLDIKCALEYPSKSAPKYYISTSYLKQIPNRSQIEYKFKEIYSENEGQCIMFDWFAEFTEFAQNIFIYDSDTQNNNNSVSTPQFINESMHMHCAIPISEQRHKLSLCPEIIFCEKFILDRKSLFKSYAARVRDVSQIKAFISKLKSNKKIAKATHNIIAYRISSSQVSDTVNEHFADDGESGGGKVILEIMRKRSIIDTVVCVSRWYGGTHLSSDRFKHIKTMTQYVLEQGRLGSVRGNEGCVSLKCKAREKPLRKNTDLAMHICNRLYWSESAVFDRNGLNIGCECRDKSLPGVIEFNLEEFGVQKSGIEWVEYLSYKGLLIWDVYHLCRTFDEIYAIIRIMQ